MTGGKGQKKKRSIVWTTIDHRTLRIINEDNTFFVPFCFDVYCSIAVLSHNCSCISLLMNPLNINMVTVDIFTCQIIFVVSHERKKWRTKKKRSRHGIDRLAHQDTSVDDNLRLFDNIQMK